MHQRQGFVPSIHKLNELGVTNISKFQTKLCVGFSEFLNFVIGLDREITRTSYAA